MEMQLTLNMNDRRLRLMMIELIQARADIAMLDVLRHCVIVKKSVRIGHQRDRLQSNQKGTDTGGRRTTRR
jgi:hypothetical protein